MLYFRGTMEKDHRGFTHQTTQETSPWVRKEKRNNNCVHSEGLRFVIIEWENRGRNNKQGISNVI